MLKDLLDPSALGGEFAALRNSVREGIPSVAVGLAPAQKAHVAATLGVPVLYLARDHVTAEQAALEMAEIAGEEAVFLPAKDDVLLLKHAFSRDSLYRRLSALDRISRGARLVATTFEALLQLFPARVRRVSFVKGDEKEPGKSAGELVLLGYRREEFAESKGTFSLRGDILDVWPVQEETPYRVDFWGDSIENVKRFDPVTKNVLSYESAVNVIAASDALAEPDEQAALLSELEDEVRALRGDAAARAREIADDLAVRLDAGERDLPFLMPLLKNATGDPFAFLPEDAAVVYDEPKMLADNLAMLEKEHAERFRGLRAGGEAFSFSLRQYADRGELLSLLASKRSLALQNVSAANPFFSPLASFRLPGTSVAKYYRKNVGFADDVRGWKANGYRVVLLAGTAARAENVREMLYENGVTSTVAGEAEVGRKGVTISPETLEAGFVYHEAKLAVVGSGDLFTKPTAEKRVRRKRGDLFSAPEIGDYCVHEVHGVGVVRGTRKITTADGTKDYIQLEYGGGDTLYVPVEQMDVLSRYLGGEQKPALSRLGGKEFERVKERVRASIREMAIDLRALYYERSLRKGFAFSKDGELMAEFENAFPYEETPDQTIAAEEVKRDMESDKVMDRLVCGDVGFGKTEIALRAAFKAILDGKQVALLAPTTILSEQHYNTCLERFRDFGVRVDVLNRFRSPAEQKETVRRLAEGTVDLVVGTHRLVSADVRFKDLGLLILDEEQRFGVETKEKLKLLKSNVDTLTLTATPIPRTLNLSLTGIRDISTIDTPPRERIPVETYVVEETETLIRDALVREIARGGQAFVLYNRVGTIFHFAEKLRAIVPEAKLTVAHGQMSEKALEDGIMEFYAGKTDVLVSTTIIENGIDLPRANTLIVIDSDRLGLSTLYQLKGRVGRSNRLAHAYFTFKRDKVLSESAYKRLSAIMEFTEMGSGFRIAMRDLEIRGAGNVLGREQHGHMDKIGYELYNKLLREEMGEEVLVDNLDLDVRADAHIPESYVESSSARLDCYKQIAEIAGDEDAVRVVGSIRENYGELPPPVVNLVRIARLKALAIRLGAAAVRVDGKRGEIELSALSKMDHAGLHAALSKFSSLCVPAFQAKPLLAFAAGKTPEETLERMIGFLDYALSFEKNG